MGARIDGLRRRIIAIPDDKIKSVLGGIVTRLANLWTRSRDGMLSIGQTFNRDDPYYQWQLGATEQHCNDCLILNGRIHTASDWRTLGWAPQSPDLECGGYNCDCRFVEVDGPDEAEDLG